MAEDTVTICPVCGSTDVGRDTEAAIGHLGGPAKWRCHHCEYTGDHFPEVPPGDVSENPKSLETLPDRPRVNTSYGSGLRGLWKFAGPFALVIGLVMLSVWQTIVELAAFSYIVILGTVLTVHAYRPDVLTSNPVLKQIKSLVVYSIPIMIILLIVAETV